MSNNKATISLKTRRIEPWVMEEAEDTLITTGYIKIVYKKKRNVGSKPEPRGVVYRERSF
jgi:hypothetical protein